MKNEGLIVGYTIEVDIGHKAILGYTNTDRSIKTQEQRIRDWAEDNLEEIDYIFSDKGESGTKVDRTEYSLLKEEIQKGRIKTLYVFNITRLGRNLPEVVSFVELCNKTKTKLIAIADSFDSTNPTSYLSFYILTAIVERRLEEKSLRKNGKSK
jgi:DNA invertase Pin-like site-specific DNA recombinase